MIRLLIVEDELLVRNGLVNHINWGDHGILVVGEANNGLEAKEAVVELQPNVVLTDIKMPGMDGLELGKWLKAHFAFVEIIYLTGYSEFEYAREALKLEAADYLLKPVNEEELFSRLKRLEKRIVDREKIKDDSNGQKLEIKNPAHIDDSPLPESTARKYRKTVEDIMTFIHEHFTQDIDLETVSRRFFLNSSYMSRIFSQETGMSFSEYLTKCRVNKAIELMINPEYKIYTISEMVGFKSEKYFTRVFKRVMGIPPQEYKEQRLR